MYTDPPVLEAYTRCSHLDQFHSTCAHPCRQAILQELRDGSDACPVYVDVRAEAMDDLADKVGGFSSRK
jgi:hypothetical protein